MEEQNAPASGELHVLHLEKLAGMLAESSHVFVSTIKLSITHARAFLVCHTGACPLIGIGIAVRGMSTFEGSVLRAGPFILSLSISRNDANQVSEVCLRSHDGSFSIVASEMWILDDVARNT